MSEFVKNLRNPRRGAQPRHSTITRKDIDGNFSSGDDRRKIKDRRVPRVDKEEKVDPAADILSEIIPVIKKSMDQMNSCMERMTNYQESLVSARIKQYEGMEKFLDHLNNFIKDISRTIPDKSILADAPSKDTTDYTLETHHSKDEVIAMIKSMRKKRATFAEIAQNLKDKEIPTFSGRGEWHAQTIHRLCRN